MSKLRPRHLIWLVLLAIDVSALAIGTVWVVRRAQADTTQEPQKPLAAVSGAPAGAGGVAQRVASNGDHPIAGSPRFVVCGARDNNGDVWLGTEDTGLWCYSASGGNWKESALLGPSGINDHDATAVACDAVGRIWVGHASHGVSISIGGQIWRNYDRTNGPIGSHVFCIATCPADGDVWIGTDAGLTRYSLANDTWTYFDRATGLPADQVNGIAFDRNGDIYLATQCDGVAMAHAADQYATWKSVVGPDDMPITPTGDGLPSRLINCVLVDRDSIVYAGTTRGLARSGDHGATWSYVRGKDWGTLAEGRYDGVPADFKRDNSSPLAEDWITALAQDPAGVIWIGYRTAGFQAFPSPGAGADYGGKGKVTTIVPLNNGQGCIIGGYGDGAILCGAAYSGTPAAELPKITSALAETEFPTSAKAPTIEELDALRQKVLALSAGKPGCDFLGDDWETTGDWIGRYGTRHADIMGYRTNIHAESGYRVAITVGPYRQSYAYSYRTDASKDANQGRGLLDPQQMTHVFTENNDGSYNRGDHPRTVEGPDLFLAVTVPEGVHRISLYFHNFDGHKGNNIYRDFYLQARKINLSNIDDTLDEDDDSAGGYLQPQDSIPVELSPTLARARVPDYWCGVYKRFLVRGAGTYWIKIGRNHSFGTKVQGVFVDRLDVPGAPDPNMPAPPPAPADQVMSGPAAAASNLWTALDGAVGKEGYANLAMRARVLAYRAAAANGADPNTLANWRWQLPMWTADDHAQMKQFVDSHKNKNG
jgi:hypothetical protein